MSEVTRVKTAHLVNSVFFNGSQQLQLILTGGVRLEMSFSGLFLIAIPPAASGKDTLHIPMQNVKGLVFIDEAAEAAKKIAIEDAALEAATKPPEAKPAKPPKSALKGVIKFVKNPDTGVIEEKLV